MSTEYYLKENVLTADPDDYNAVVVSRGTSDLDALAQMMIQQGSTLTPEDIKASFESMRRSVIALLQQGFRVVTPVATLSATIHGVFTGEEDAFDPKRHQARLNTQAYHDLEKTWRSGAKFTKVASQGRVAPVPETYHDVTGSARNSVLTPNSVGRLTGQNLKLEIEDPQQGVFFKGENETETRAEVYVKAKPRELIFMTPALPAGDYTVRVCARVPGSKDKIRCGHLEHTLTVA